jgi:hypothetical protein
MILCLINNLYLIIVVEKRKIRKIYEVLDGLTCLSFLFSMKKARSPILEILKDA